jgi:hypothetical protein
VIDSDLLAVLPAHPSTILSVFVMEMSDSRIVEVKVIGVDWPPASNAFPQEPFLADGVIALSRELAILTPLSEPTVPSRSGLDRTLAGLGAPNQADRSRRLAGLALA